MNELQHMLLDAARRIFQEHLSNQTIEESEKGHFAGELWRLLEEAGMTLVDLPESAGGGGATFGDMIALIRLSGHSSVPLPLVETAIAASELFGAGLEVPQGPMSFGPVDGGGGADGTLTLARAGGCWKVSGIMRRIPWGRHASHLVTFVEDPDGCERLIRLRGEAVSKTVPGDNIAGEQRDTLVFDEVDIDEAEIGPASQEGETRLFEVGALCRAAQMAGALQRALEMSVVYTNERQQFGRTLSKFQAIQQQLAVAAGHVAAAAAAVDGAVAARGSDKAEFAVAVAKSRVGEAAGQVAEIAHQVHGAMGFTREYGLHYSTRRLWSWRDEFGNEAYWQRRLGRLSFAVGADGLWPTITGS